MSLFKDSSVNNIKYKRKMKSFLVKLNSSKYSGDLFSFYLGNVKVIISVITNDAGSTIYSVIEDKKTPLLGFMADTKTFNLNIYYFKTLESKLVAIEESHMFLDKISNEL